MIARINGPIMFSKVWNLEFRPMLDNQIGELIIVLRLMSEYVNGAILLFLRAYEDPYS